MQYRDLIWTLCIHRWKVRYRQSALGWLWAVVQPLSLLLIYSVIFSVVARVNTGEIPYALFVLSALLPWTLFSSIVATASSSLTKHTQLITKVYFPREILPITYVVIGLFDFVIGATFLIAIMVYFGVPPGPAAWAAIPLLLVITAIGIALTLVFSALEVRFRDIGLAMPLLLQVWMLASPVFYPMAQVPERFRAFYILNPLAGALENFRRALLGNEPLDWASLRVSLAVAAIILPTAYLYFKHREASMADII